MTELKNESRCELCGRENPVWFTKNYLWNSVMRRPDGADRLDFVCPVCFIRLYERQFGHIPGAWALIPESELRDNEAKP